MAGAAPLAKTARPSATAHGGTAAQALSGNMVQAKLDVGPSSDHFEREADTVARRVVSGGDAPVAIPPTITPISAQRKAEMPKPSPAMEEERPAEKAQRKVGGGGVDGGTAPAAVEASIARMRAGSGSGLDGGTRSFMENRFGRDFSGVRVHNGSGAANAATALGARAFTVGNDVFFNTGQYRPQTRSGRELLAHELTHTVQQAGRTGVAARKLVQREDDESAVVREDDETPSVVTTRFNSTRIAGASIDTTNTGLSDGTVTLPSLGLPEVAGSLKGVRGSPARPYAADSRTIPVAGQSFTLGPVQERDSPVAAQVWTSYAQTHLRDGTARALTQKIAAAPHDPNMPEIRNAQGEQVHYLSLTGTRAADRQMMFIGTVAELSDSDAILRPQWTREGRALTSRNERLDADHILELQIGGQDSGRNMWLLRADYNQSVGNRLKTNIESQLRVIKEELASAAGIPDTEKPADIGFFKRNWTLQFSNVAQGANFPEPTESYWTQEDIGRGNQLQPLRLLSQADLVAAGIVLPAGQENPSFVPIFPTAAGGRAARVALNPAGEAQAPMAFLFQNIFAESATYTGATAATDATDAEILTLNVVINKKTRDNNKKEILQEKRGQVVVRRHPNLGLGGYIDARSIRSQLSEVEFTPLSPLRFSDMGVSPEGALAGTGDIFASKALFPGLEVPIVLVGDQIRMDFPVPVENLSLGPFSITEASIGLGVGEDGFFVQGYAGFEIASLGTGSITATASREGPEIAGEFNLAMDFLNPAQVIVNYNLATDEMRAEATLGVEAGRIPGVESGQVTVVITRETVSVDGTINLGGPLAGSSIAVGYTPEEGLTIGGTFPLPVANLPAVQNATITVGAARDPDTGAWRFSGAGTAELAAPGATGTIEIGYLDGVVTLRADATVEKGPASGTLTFTATNAAIDDEGNPVDGEVGNSITAWGRGSVTIRFGNIIQGTAAIEYTQDNRIILSGSIGLPPVYEIFPRRDYQRDLLHLEPPEFPIWGVSVAGVGVGIFAFVDARIYFNAFVGPGQIRDAAIEAEMDLDRPEDATIHGHGEFFVPAYAGLNLDVGGGLRARLAVAYAQGRVGLEGRLGIEADASAAVDIDWNRNDGLSLEADFEANARPKFELLANASVTVGVDLLVTDVSHTFGPWERSLGEFGPDMEMGVNFPVRWSEAEGLDLSLDNMTIREPQLDASGLMGDVFDRLAG